MLCGGEAVAKKIGMTDVSGEEYRVLMELFLLSTSKHGTGVWSFIDQRLEMEKREELKIIWMNGALRNGLPNVAQQLSARYTQAKSKSATQERPTLKRSHPR